MKSDCQASFVFAVSANFDQHIDNRTYVYIGIVKVLGIVKEYCKVHV